MSVRVQCGQSLRGGVWSAGVTERRDVGAGEWRSGGGVEYIQHQGEGRGRESEREGVRSGVCVEGRASPSNEATVLARLEVYRVQGSHPKL